MKAKLIGSMDVVQKLNELGIKGITYSLKYNLIVVAEHTCRHVSAEDFAACDFPFLEERDLLKMTPIIKIGDYVQIPYAHGLFIRQVAKIAVGNILTIKTSGAHVTPVTYPSENVKRVPDYIIEILKTEGVMDE